MAKFVLKIPNFRYNGTVELLDLENPLFGATFVSLSLVLAEF